eukprot:3985741-Lingulodinium_polyedra.AAC.1
MLELVPKAAVALPKSLPGGSLNGVKLPNYRFGSLGGLHRSQGPTSGNLALRDVVQGWNPPR